MSGHYSHHIREEIGGTTEMRFWMAFQAPGWEWPKWYRGFRRATKEEDAKGIDAIFHTDVGDIPVQIKSSRRHAKEHEERYGDAHIVVVVRPSVPQESLRRHVLGLVGNRRRNRHRRKKHSANKQARAA